MTHELHHLAAAYALDALDDQERRDFEAHYPTCSICAQEVLEFRDTAAALAETTAESPPDSVKADVMARISDTRQLPPVVSPIARRTPRSTTWVLAAAAALILVLGTLVVVQRVNNTDQFTDVVAADDAVFTSLDGSDGSVQVWWSASRGQVAVQGVDLDDPGPNKAMALWSLLDDGVAPAGLFRPDDGAVQIVLDVADDVAPNGWGITIEPDTGSAQPTTEVIYVGTI